MSAHLPPLPKKDLAHILSHTSNVWDNFKDKTIFITGGTGFFGIWLLESLAYANRELNLNCKAIVLSRDPEKFKNKLPHLKNETMLSFIKGDVSSFSLPEKNIDYIIHAATEASAKLNEENPEEMLKTISAGTKRVLEFAKVKGVKRLLLTSSGAVYGKQPGEITHIEESYKFDNTNSHFNAYAEGKREAEKMCQEYHHNFGIESVIARCFAFVGPHLPLDIHFAIGNFIRNAINETPINILGDGTPMRSYLYSSDLMIWLWTLLVKGAPSVPYNVGSNRDLSIKKTAELVLGNCPTACKEVLIAKTPNPDAPIARYVPSCEKVENELGLKQLISTEEAIQKTYKWHVDGV